MYVCIYVCMYVCDHDTSFTCIACTCTSNRLICHKLSCKRTVTAKRILRHAKTLEAVKKKDAAMLANEGVREAV